MFFSGFKTIEDVIPLSLFRDLPVLPEVALFFAIFFILLGGALSPLYMTTGA